MKLCLIMIARFETKDGFIYGDKKNINAIKRYLKYFDEINVVARLTEKSSSLYPREKIEFIGKSVSFNLFNEMKSIKYVGTFMKEFKDRIKKGMENSDIVLCWAEPKSNIIVKMAKRLNKPCIVYVGGCNRDTLFSSKSLIRKLAGILVYYSNKKAIMNADYVHYVTNIELQKRYPTRGKYIGASYVNINTNISEIQKMQRIRRYDNKLEKISLGLIGYLNEVKGIDTAITALSKLDDRFILKILGGGDASDYRKLAERLGVEKRVLFEGTLPPGEPILKWLDDIDIYLQPSRTEGLPRATIEAMSRGCPTISSNAMGLKELIEEKWTHKPGDSNKMAKLISEISSNTKELSKQSIRSFEITKRYNRELLDKTIDNFFNDIINNSLNHKGVM